MRSYASVFRLLSFDASGDAIIPLSFCQTTMRFLETCDQNQCTKSSFTEYVEKLSFFSSEYVNLIIVTSDGITPTNAVLKLLRRCTKLVIDYHSSDNPPEAPFIMEGTYNPPKLGRAYYFSSHGCQMREVRKFPIDSDRSSENFDDAPDLLCAKRFPQVSKQGTSYLFLWFSLQHGHCYGYHIIPGSEGRKDAAASLYTHTETAPDVILYDFACSLSEYCRNRELGYFQNTRFYHDVFHGFSHKCTLAFSCGKLRGFKTVSSSIWEQFNSFIQNIKTSAKLISQCHFTFYLQFFIDVWNKQKLKTFERNKNIAIYGKI